MYRLFHRFELLAFSIVTLSAVACAGILVAHWHPGLSELALALPHSVAATAAFAPDCLALCAAGACEPLLAGRKEDK
ncbi:hypothetical protein WJ47_24370 [Burkholderia ubonensis]|uniref:Lipoprotein n=1 Tax=Burkholderia ubonensis TaxID=101571 RepID=A0AB73G3L3_9BURK|nr:hypothetical protein [Burkholderia ubonensis]KVK78016.1 hypothetical protein WJ44_15660 [Burkholderia ubonensis]KVL81350.1 hypothetical protein WJ47_24370 [Burkholderia ubonensis]KVM23130.1 hypothetical protein WJ54_21380 [Burkholderia ubonensis]KVM35726.1 hypothetical protein WJ53_31650 [Burkholderia ubonensis]KVR35467.1 hypothetical protein WK13_17730 [Burkholderia ubonensis]